MAEQRQSRTREAVARALNTFGESVARSVAKAIAERTDLDVNDVMNEMEIKEATSSSLRWELDASSIAPKTDDWQRPWETRDNSTFQGQTLVKIITSEDHSVCDVCNAAAENSPYTMDEINEMKAKWVNFAPATGEGVRTNLVHPNCRCALQPWNMSRRLPLTMGNPAAAPPELFTARQLGKAVADELRVMIKAT